MNTELITKVLKRIEKEHRHFNMSWWYIKITEKFRKTHPKFDCGTACCFAGDILIERLGPGALIKLDETEIANVAQTIAGFSDVDKEKLFFTGPSSTYTDIHLYEPGTKAYAKYVVGCIRAYCAARGYTV